MTRWDVYALPRIAARTASIVASPSTVQPHKVRSRRTNVVILIFVRIGRWRFEAWRLVGGA
jgi:hypothetical protein